MDGSLSRYLTIRKYPT